LQGGVDPSLIRWVPYDGVGRRVRNGVNFTERGFGVRGALGCSDRGNTAASQLRAGDIDWNGVFRERGSRWFHCGGIFAGLSGTTADVAEEAMEAAREAGVVVSYDLNYRPSLWSGVGGSARAVEVNRRLVERVDVIFGNEEDFNAALGYEIPGSESGYLDLDAEAYGQMLQEVVCDFPNVKIAATSLRTVHSASANDWGGLCYADGEVIVAESFDDLAIFDRVGGGDSFASGFIYGVLSGFELERALEYAVAHGALSMTTPGDTSMATLREVEALVARVTARVDR